LAIYQGRWQNAVDALRKHDVEYVYVGPTEREKYGRLLHDFGSRDGFSVAFTNSAVTIYEVDRSALSKGG
jgi:uncharacterized membrane protein